MPAIANYDSYTSRMRKSLLDKAFFFDKIPQAKLIIDFGCADGSLIAFLHQLDPEMCFIGIDNNPDMIARCDARNLPARWFTSVDDCIKYVKQWGGVHSDEVCINFSSVFHEVFHYNEGKSEIAKLIHQLRPQYISIRDMMYHCTMFFGYDEEIVDQVRANIHQWQISNFESCFGSIDDPENLVHFLLKYRYQDNWARECEENYFSYSLVDLFRLIDPDGIYTSLWMHQYVLPWFRFRVKKDIGIDIEDFLPEITTHYQMILSRKEGR